MTTERMDGLLMEASRYDTPDEIWHETCRARRVEQEQSEKIRKLETMLRLANDKMAEQVRQARLEVADEALGRLALARGNEAASAALKYLAMVRDANAPKD